MHIMAIALGGCISENPRYGITEDTGGHITYILGAMRALAERPDVSQAEIVTRLFDDPHLGKVHAQPSEDFGNGVTITRIDSGNRDYLSKERLAKDIPAFTKALIRELRDRPKLPDIVHAHFADAAQVARSIRDELGIPFIYTAHSLAIDKQRANPAGCPGLTTRIALEDAAIGAANAIVGSSRDECERQLLAYPSADETRIHRIRPGVEQHAASPDDIEQARALIAPFLRAPDKPLILAIARPVHKKNLAGLVEAYAQSPALQNAANLVILPGLRQSLAVGESEQVEVLAELVDLIDRNDLHGKVAYPRRHCADQVRGLYALARETGGVFVNPALVEPFGLTILEAAVHGLPVVATCRGGPCDIIREIGHGETVEPTDTGAIAKAVEGLLTDSAAWDRASRNAFARIESVTWTAYAKALRKVAGSIVRKTPVAVRAARPQSMLVCDIDNTLTGCRRSAADLSRYLGQRGDIAFGVATGRSLVEARRLIRDWDLPQPEMWITSVGSEIYWRRGQELCPDERFASVIAAGWDGGKLRETLADYEHIVSQGEVDHRAYKASYEISDPSRIDEISDALREAGISARVVLSHGRLVDVLPMRAGKGAAVAHAARTLGLTHDRVIVAGDSGNDIDMLTSCPNAILVANCEPELRKLQQNGGIYHARGRYAAGVLEGMRVHLQAMEMRPMEYAA